ncbi:MAG TPA: VOC family protein [Actinomycetes bacterium]|nr:VOC family protein [Actinomycetes bacterium]
MSQPLARPVAVLDHLVLAAGPDGLQAMVEPLTQRLGLAPTPGGVHPGLGTTNAIVALADGVYLEVVAVADQAAAARSSFGRAVAARQHAGGGWVGWAARLPTYDALADAAAGAGLALADGERTRPDGRTLRWRTAGFDRIEDEPVLPFLIAWDVDDDDHPSHVAPDIARPPRVRALELAGDPHALRRRLGGELAGVRLSWVGITGGLRAVELDVAGALVAL